MKQDGVEQMQKRHAHATGDVLYVIIIISSANPF